MTIRFTLLTNRLGKICKTYRIDESGKFKKRAAQRLDIIRIY